MAGGHIQGREINALTINADDRALILSMDGGYKICIHKGHTKVTLLGNSPFTVPVACLPFVAYSPRAVFQVSTRRSCVS